MRPYAPANRCTKVFAGHVHTFEKNLLRCDWSPDGAKVRRAGGARRGGARRGGNWGAGRGLLVAGGLARLARAAAALTPVRRLLPRCFLLASPLASNPCLTPRAPLS